VQPFFFFKIIIVAFNFTLVYVREMLCRIESIVMRHNENVCPADKLFEKSYDYS
jgi:hypothetical protein